MWFFFSLSLNSFELRLVHEILKVQVRYRRKKCEASSEKYDRKYKSKNFHWEINGVQCTFCYYILDTENSVVLIVCFSYFYYCLLNLILYRNVETCCSYYYCSIRSFISFQNIKVVFKKVSTGSRMCFYDTGEEGKIIMFQMMWSTHTELKTI